MKAGLEENRAGAGTQPDAGGARLGRERGLPATFREWSGSAAWRVPAGLVVFGCFLVLLVFTCSPVLTSRYALWEDFGVHHYPHGHPHGVDGILTGFLRLVAVHNRLVAVGVYYVSMLLAPFVSLKGLWVFRFLALVGMSGLATLLFKELRAARLDRYVAFALAAAMMLCPGFLVLASWVHMYYIPGAAIIAYLGFKAGVLALRHWEAAPQVSGRARLRAALYFGAAALCCVTAMNVYQPGAMYLWVFMAIFIFQHPDDLARVRKQFLVTLAACLAGFVLALVSLKLTEAYLGGHIARTEIVRDIKAKAVWFATEPLPLALSPFLLEVRLALAGAVGLAMAGSLLAYFRGPFLTRLGMTAACLLTLPLAYLPNLVVGESQFSFRSMLALGPLGILFIGFALVCWSRLCAPGNPLLVRGALGLLLLVGALLAQFNLANRLTTPLAMELALIKDRLGRVDFQRVQNVRIILPQPLPWKLYAEFGELSGRSSWASVDGVRSAVNEVSPATDARRLNITSQLPTEPVPPDPSGATYVLDMREIAEAIRRAVR